MENIAEILKNCPKGTKLYSPIFGECELLKIYTGLGFDVINETGNIFNLSYDGRYNLNGECCIFPSKDNRDWDKFQIPFKDGDIITCTNSICSFVAIFKEMNTDTTFRRYVSLTLDDKRQFLIKESWSDFKNPRFATEEEKQKLFDTIKANGYKWNGETKTLEKLIEPKFKVGDRIKESIGGKREYTISIVTHEFYVVTEENNYTYHIPFKNEEFYELIPNKFDISTLKPFDKVLVRDNNEQKWTVDMFSFYDKTLIYPFNCIGHCVNQCIPYKGNEHLLGTTNDCYEYYKTWK